MNVNRKINVNAIKSRIAKIQMNILRQESALESSRAELEYWSSSLDYAKQAQEELALGPDLGGTPGKLSKK